jgi:dipeptidase E
MKLLLCSEGFHTPNTVQACVDLVGKPKEEITFAIINEAYAAEHGDKRWVLDNLNDVARNFPGELDIVNLLALSLDEIEERVMQKDVIFVVGGHTDYLMSVFVKTGFDKLLPKLLKSKVYVGSSAGSMVMGKRLSPEAYEGMYDVVGFGTEQYLEFVDFTFMPHMDSADFPGRKDKLFEISKNHRGIIYGLRDDSAIIIDDDKFEITGSEPYIVQPA